MATINLYLRPEMKDSHGLMPVYLIFQHKGQRFKHYTGTKVLPENWDTEHQQVNASHPEFEEVNSKLKIQKDLLEKISKDPNVLNGAFNLKELRASFDKIKNQNSRKSNLFDELELFIEQSKLSKKESTLIIYQILMKDLKRFDNKYDYRLDFKKINEEFYTSFTQFLEQELNNTNNTVSKKIKSLKAFLHFASEKNLINPIDFQKFSTKTVAAVKISLTEIELSKIFNLNLSLSPELGEARDLFLFGCFTGLKFSDIIKLKPTDVADARLHIVNQYTNQGISVPFNNYAKMILKRYEGRQTARCFPKIETVYANKFVKQLGKLAGITKPVEINIHKGSEIIKLTKPKYELITSDTARFTYAILSLQSGMRPELLIQILGQKSINALLQYTFEHNPMKDIELVDCWNNKVF